VRATAARDWPPVAPLGFARGPRRLQLWVAPHLGRRAEILALEKWRVQEMGEMREMGGTGDIAVP
jgi:hypothetical protein